MNSTTNTEKIDQLLEEMAESRATLRSYVSDVSKLKDKVAQMFPNDLNFRNRFVLDEKIKTMTSFYSVLLNIQQEINKSNKDEIEIRRKLDSTDEGEDTELDLRRIADMVLNQTPAVEEISVETQESSQLLPPPQQ